MREKDRGIWQSYSWRDCYAHVRDFALGLAAAGFKRGDKLSVLGDNRARLYWAQLAAQALGGMAVPLYQDSIASELAYVLDHAEVSVVVAEDQEQVDKVLSLAGELPNLRLVIYDDPLGMSAYTDDILKSFAEMEEAGRAFAKEHPGYFERELEQGRADDVALIAYTSGTTGRSKGVLLSHANMIATSESFASVESVARGDNWLCYLPMGWVGDSIFSLSTSLVVGATCNCPESPETVQRDLRELGPSALLGPPRIWENMLTALQVRAADASPLKRRVYEYFRRLAERRELLKGDGKPISRSMRARLSLGEYLVYGPVRDQLGLRNARWCLTGGAPLGADTFRFFRSFGVNLKQIYGATEASALVALQANDEADPNTVGRTLPGTDVRIGERGEVQVKGPGVFVGYYKQDDATRDAITPDGWLKTGDAGLVDPRGQLAIIDRAKDVGKLADGTPFAPQFVENKLKYSPFIREAVAFGDQRAVRGGDDRHRHRDRRQVGGAERPGLYQLHGPRAQGRGGAPHRRGGRQDQRHAARGDQGAPHRAPQQGARRRRRRDDAHPQGAPRVRGGEVRPGDQGALRRRHGDAADHGHHLRGRPQEPAHLDHAGPRHRPPAAAGRLAA